MANSNIDIENKSPFKFKIVDQDTFDYIIDEGGAGFLALRKIAWKVGQDEEHDPDKVRIDIRKWRLDPDGSERMSKGCSMRPEAANELANTLIKAGFGDTKEILTSLKDREDFAKVIPIVFTDDDIIESEDGDIYDPRKVLLG